METGSESNNDLSFDPNANFDIDDIFDEKYFEIPKLEQSTENALSLINMNKIQLPYPIDTTSDTYFRIFPGNTQNPIVDIDFSQRDSHVGNFMSVHPEFLKHRKHEEFFSILKILKISVTLKKSIDGTIQIEIIPPNHLSGDYRFWLGNGCRTRGIRGRPLENCRKKMTQKIYNGATFFIHKNHRQHKYYGKMLDYYTCRITIGIYVIELMFLK